MSKHSTRLLSLLVFALPNLLSAQTISIAEARQTPVGNTVTVRGVVTNGPELGNIRYLQDGTAGIGAFPGSGSVSGFAAAVMPGDSIEVTGKLTDFKGLLEISPITAYSVITSGNPMPAPKPASLGALGEDLEGQLLSFDCTSFDNPGTPFATATTYPVADINGNSSVVFLRSTSPILGTTIPSGSVRLVAILSQFTDYQLLPRTTDDLQQQTCFYIVNSPEQSDIQADGFRVDWAANLPSFNILKYGLAPDNLDKEAVSPGAGADHFVTLTGLQPGTIYWVQAVGTHNGDSASSDIVPMATRSLSSGEVKIYFNHSTLPTGPQPAGQSFDEVLAATIARIDAATQTIDVAMYNNSRDDITAALVAAHNRGVRVRYVAAVGGTSPALNNPAPPFPVIYGNQSYLMHNKFMVVDAENTQNCWVMGGSMNWTTGNMEDDYNNTLFIQDQSLARTYTLEFTEMWGSAGPQPDLNNTKFGAQKRDNTPHRFIIGGIPVESYFSPSDQTTKHIGEVLASADEDLFFALLVFTKDDLGQIIALRQAAGVTCRGIIDNWNDNGSEYQYLLTNGVPVIGDTRPAIVHHKYGVADATTPTSDPTVSTGSHNWSLTAEISNDENTLIIHDAAIALLYRQEFDRRWQEVSATYAPDFQRVGVYPNPASTNLTFNFGEENPALARVELFNAAGQPCLSRQFLGGESPLVSVAGLPSGFYFAKILTRDGRFAAVSFQKI